jgi:GLPGLI family protein
MKNLIFFLLLLPNFLAVAQNRPTIYKVTYKVEDLRLNQTNEIQIKKDSSLTKPLTVMGVDVSAGQILKDMLFHIQNIELDLYCTATESIFKLQEGLEPETFSPGYVTAVAMTGVYPNGNRYKNYQKKLEMEHRNGSDGTINIIYPYKEYDWDIRHDTTKIILGHLCYQATAKWKELGAMASDSIQRVATVWFTKDIPAPFGPDTYGGLPGLILETCRNRITMRYYATKIYEHYVDKSQMLREPKAQRTTTQAEQSKKFRQQMKEAEEYLETQKH